MNDSQRPFLNETRLSEAQHKAIAVGAFDGCHTGHQALLQQADYAVTFWPLPKTYFARQEKSLTLFHEKQKLFKNFLFIYFDRKFALQSPSFFIEFLMTHLHPAKIIVGWDFRFGHQLKGDVDTIREAIAGQHVELIAVPPVSVAGQVVKSTDIRQAIESGDIASANRLLGYEFFFDSKVIPGKGVGRQLGFPTVNLAIHPEKIMPAPGVYKGMINIQGREYAVAISNLLKDKKSILEAHILDFSGDLYGQELSLRFQHFIRPIKNFKTHDDLIRQIVADVGVVRKLKA